MMKESNPTVFAIAFASYSLLIVLVGLLSARFAKRSDEDYFLAGRSLGKWIAALSASASSESGWVTLGLVGWAFTQGVKAYWIMPGCLLGFAFNWFLLAGRLSDQSRQLNAITVPDFFSFRFRERLPILRILSVIVIAVAMLLYVAAQFAAAGKSFGASFLGTRFADVWFVIPIARFLPFLNDLTISGDYSGGVLLGAAIVLIYTVTGGFRAVCWTDFLQALLMVITLVVFPVFLLATQGGFGFVDQQLSLADPNLMRFTPDKVGMALIGFLLGHGALGINFGYPGQPHVLIRYMALKSRKEVALGGVIAIIWGAMVYWGAVTVGLMARAMTLKGVDWTTVAENIDGEQSLVLAARYMLPGALSGMVLAAVLAAICSTADSQLVVAASAVANDLYTRLFSKAKGVQHVLLDRTVVFVLGAIAVLLVIDQDIRVYDYVLTYGWAFLGASFGPQMILALFWKRASYAGCIAGMAVGFAMAIVWPNIYDPAPGPDKEMMFNLAREGGAEVYNLPFAFVCALVVNFLVSLIFPSRDSGGPAAETSSAR
jgi:SSS family transporter